MEQPNDRREESISSGDRQNMDERERGERIWINTQREVDDVEKAIERCSAEYIDLHRRVEHVKADINEYAKVRGIREPVDFDEVNAMARRISAAKDYLAKHQTQIVRETATAYAKSIAEWQIVGLATVQITEWMPSCDVLIDVQNVVYLTINDTNRTTNH